jgi:hypothetical protein
MAQDRLKIWWIAQDQAEILAAGFAIAFGEITNEP